MTGAAGSSSASWCSLREGLMLPSLPWRITMFPRTTPLITLPALYQPLCQASVASHRPYALIRSRTRIKAFPSTFSPHLSRFASALFAPYPTPQILSRISQYGTEAAEKKSHVSNGDAFRSMVSDGLALRARGFSYLHKFPLTCPYKHVSQLCSLFWVAEFVPVALFDDLLSMRIPCFPVKPFNLPSERFLLLRCVC